MEQDGTDQIKTPMKKNNLPKLSLIFNHQYGCKIINIDTTFDTGCR
jgi:hypothetical protein